MRYGLAMSLVNYIEYIHALEKFIHMIKNKR